jgi:hypothetical protein
MSTTATAAAPPNEATATPPSRPAVLAAAWRWFKAAVVFVIVVVHLFLFVLRNPLDLWYKPVKAWLEKHEAWWAEYGEAFKRTDRFTERYLNLVGCEQGWAMFTPPMARSAPFLAYRIEFSDGPPEEVLSSREPADPSAFFRIGDWQTRKYEDYLCYPPDNLAEDPELPLWETAARRVVANWKALHPGESRKVRRVVMLKRTIDFPGPDETPGAYLPARESEVARFDGQGRLMP